MTDSSEQRSPRVTVDIPVRVEGRSLRGQRVAADARAINVSLHGVLLRAAIELVAGSQVTVRNPANNLTAGYRVVWAQADAAGGWRMGLELVSGSTALWGLDLGPQSEGEAETV
jgi:hypothetical protein